MPEMAEQRRKWKIAGPGKFVSHQERIADVDGYVSEGVRTGYVDGNFTGSHIFTKSLKM